MEPVDPSEWGRDTDPAGADDSEGATVESDDPAPYEPLTGAEPDGGDR